MRMNSLSGWFFGGFPSWQFPSTARSSGNVLSPSASFPRSLDHSSLPRLHLLTPSEFSSLTATTLNLLICAPCGIPGHRRKQLINPFDTIRQVNTLDPSTEPRPYLGRAITTQLTHRDSRSTFPSELSLADIIKQGPEWSPWSPKSPYYLSRRSSSLREESPRRASRQFDGSKSSTPSTPTPTVSRANSFSTRFNPGSLERSGTGDSAISSRSNNSTHSSKSSRRSCLNRVETIGDDRNLQGHEARQERQLREPGPGADGEPNSAPHGGQGQRGFFGMHKSKSAR